MSFSELFFLSLIQGITEFLPISSSAHLILFTEYFGSSKQSITVDVFAHFGTLIAVLIYFRKDLEVIFRTYQVKELNGLGNCLIIATLPILIIGFFLRDFVEIYLRNQNVKDLPSYSQFLKSILGYHLLSRTTSYNSPSPLGYERVR